LRARYKTAIALLIAMSALFLREDLSILRAKSGPRPAQEGTSPRRDPAKEGIRMAPRTRPVIGLNVDYVPASKVHRPHLRLNGGYAEAVQAAGGLPVLMPLLGAEADIAAFLDRVDGFLLSSGQDLDPRRQGLPRHAAVQPMPERREEHDRLLVRLLLERQLPILGVGTGMHLLNVICGGSLYMHLPEDLPRAMPHSDPSCSGPHRHLVNLQPGTRLDEIYGSGELRVNSSHHQAVKQVGPRFRTCALAPDGVIEAIEGTDANWFCVGVQWHPESDSASALDAQLFESFVQACARPAQSLTSAA
jgi:putative glutamine amidotransferase